MLRMIDIPDELYNDVINDGVLYVDYESVLRDAIKTSIGLTLPCSNCTHREEFEHKGFHCRHCFIEMSMFEYDKNTEEKEKE